MTLSGPRARVVARLLNDATYDIEFNGFLTNHAKHAVVALAGLGASPGRIESYWSKYTELTPYGFPLRRSRAATVEIDAAERETGLGQRQDFEAYRRWFAARLDAEGVDCVLAAAGPRLLEGCVGALLHGTIHLGWALEANHPAMIAEGLAYLAFTFVSVHPERHGGFTADADVWTSVLRIAAAFADGGLGTWVAGLAADPALSPEQGFAQNLAGTGAQLTIAQIIGRGHPLVDAVPRWLDVAPLPTIWDALYEMAALLYCAEPGDFVMLHVLTGLHALEHIATRLPEAHRRDALRCGWRAIVAVLLSRGNLAAPARLQALRAELAGVVDPDAARWAPIVARALTETEEHNIKLVHVLRRQWSVRGRRSLYRQAASHFTVTPVVPRFARSSWPTPVRPGSWPSGCTTRTG